VWTSNSELAATRGKWSNCLCAVAHSAQRAAVGVRVVREEVVDEVVVVRGGWSGGRSRGDLPRRRGGIGERVHRTPVRKLANQIRAPLCESVVTAFKASP